MSCQRSFDELYYFQWEGYINPPLVYQSAASFFHCAATMDFKDEIDVGAVARAGLEKLGYKQEMTRVCDFSCSCSISV